MQEATTSARGEKWLLLLVVGVLLAVTGCQTLLTDPRGRMVPEDKRIALPDAGERTGDYKTEDLVLPYKLVRTDGRLNISGTIHFERRIAENFLVIGYFHMDAVLLDAQGKVQGLYGLVTTTYYNTEYVTPSSPPLTFNTAVTVSDNTAAVAFSYTGQASRYAQSGGSGSSFWEYPYR